MLIAIFGDEEKARQVLETVDWSAAADQYRLCVAALRGEIGEVTRLMDLVVKAGTMQKESFREWPALDYIRENEEFMAKFKDLFAEPLLDNTDKTSNLQGDKEIAENLEDAEDTLH